MTLRNVYLEEENVYREEEEELVFNVTSHVRLKPGKRFTKKKMTFGNVYPAT
jgi:hypothetical protein